MILYYIIVYDIIPVNPLTGVETNLLGWLDGLLACWPAHLLSGWLVGRMAGWLACPCCT